jgi:putative acetyltransferase
VIEVRRERAANGLAIDAVHRAAFGHDDEARLVAALRVHGDLYLGLVAVDGDAVVGHIAFSPATLHCYSVLFPLMALGPMAVRPDVQRRGIGSALVREGLAACRARGHEVVVVLGHPEFYPRFGFVPGRTLGVMTEYPVPDEAFMVAELAPGALRNRRGVVYYAPEFSLVAPTTTHISAWESRSEESRRAPGGSAGSA